MGGGVKMKILLSCACLLITTTLVLGETNVVRSNTQKTMKGYVLYGYTCSNEVFYVLMAGTNRKKQFAEIDTSATGMGSSRILFKTKGVDSTKALLDELDVPVLTISGIREAPDVMTDSVPVTVTSAPVQDLEALRNYWMNRRKR